MKRFIEYLAIYTIGSIGYGIIEVLYRGYTHWSMMITGGICFIIIYIISSKLKAKNLLVKAVYGALAITLVEFTVGIVVNKIMRLNVWDYSALKFNILGQVSLLFTFMWFLICIPAIGLASFICNGFMKLNENTDW